MKKIFAAFLVVFSIVACDDDSNDGPSRDAQVQSLENIARSGQWRVTFFEDTGNDETAHFTGYVFGFDANNVLTASNGSTNHSGTWSIVDDGGSDDDNKGDYDDIDFNIAFSSPDNFEELSEDWEIISMSSTKMELRHISGGNGGTDLLTFEKI